MTIPKRNDELALFAVLRAAGAHESKRPRDSQRLSGIQYAHALGMHWRRAAGLFEKWESKGWWDEVGSRHFGYLTLKAPQSLEEMAGYPVALDVDPQAIVRQLAQEQAADDDRRARQDESIRRFIASRAAA